MKTHYSLPLFASLAIACAAMPLDAETVLSAGTYTINAFTPMPANENVLRGLSAVHTDGPFEQTSDPETIFWEVNGRFTYYERQDDTTVLTDGRIPLSSDYTDPGRHLIENGAKLTWSLAAPTSISEFRIYTQWKDGYRTDISVDSIEVRDSEGVWKTIPGTKFNFSCHQSRNTFENQSYDRECHFRRVFVTSSDGDALASDVNAVRISFGTQDVGYGCYWEIEARGGQSTIQVSESVALPGLYQARLKNPPNTPLNSLDTLYEHDESSGIVRTLGAEMGLSMVHSYEESIVNPLDGTAYYWADFTTYLYSGFIWMRTGDLFEFIVDQDDCGFVMIDDTIAVYASECRSATGSFTAGRTGWHAIEIRVGNGQGYAGAQRHAGVGYRVNGNGDFIPLRDPGDGSLLRCSRICAPDSFRIEFAERRERTVKATVTGLFASSANIYLWTGKNPATLDGFVLTGEPLAQVKSGNASASVTFSVPADDTLYRLIAVSARDSTVSAVTPVMSLAEACAGRYTWSGTSGGAWNDPANWTRDAFCPDGSYPNENTCAVTFETDATVKLVTDARIGSLALASGANVTVVAPDANAIDVASAHGGLSLATDSTLTLSNAVLNCQSVTASAGTALNFSGRHPKIGITGSGMTVDDGSRLSLRFTVPRDGYAAPVVCGGSAALDAPVRITVDDRSPAFYDRETKVQLISWPGGINANAVDGSNPSAKSNDYISLGWTYGADAQATSDGKAPTGLWLTTEGRGTVYAVE